MVEFRILGPLEVVEDGRELVIGSGRQKALVCLLLVHRNTVVSTDRVVDELWGERPPPSAAKIVRNTVSLLRKQLGGRLVTRAHGYVMLVESEELDVDRFESLCRAPSDEGPEAAAVRLREALALFRGPPLVDLGDEPFARAETRRLVELRLACLEARIDADLAMGLGRELVPELEALTREYPLRERFYGQLMLALYRSDRQAEALEIYNRARQLLTSELGLEPSPALQDIQRRILNQDTTIAASTPRRPVSHGSRRRRLVMAIGATCLLAAAAAAAVELSASGNPGLSTLAPNSIGVIDPSTNRLTAEVALGAAPSAIAVGRGIVWAASTQGQTVFALDAKQRLLKSTIPVAGPPAAIAVGPAGIWTVYLRTPNDSGAGEPFAGGAGIAALGTTPGGVLASYPVGAGFGGDFQDSIAVTANSVWAFDPSFITRLDPSSGRVLARVAVGPQDEGIVAGDESLWALAGDVVTRIDPKSNQVVAEIPIAGTATADGPIPTAIAFGEGAIWVTSRIVARCPPCESKQPGLVTRIDTSTDAVTATIPVGHDPYSVAAGEGAVWAANRRDQTVSRIDPRTNRVTNTISLGSRPQAVAAGQGAVWIAVG
jgi:YVTN family beta-propeller protein